MAKYEYGTSPKKTEPKPKTSKPKKEEPKKKGNAGVGLVRNTRKESQTPPVLDIMQCLKRVFLISQCLKPCFLNIAMF